MSFNQEKKIFIVQKFFMSRKVNRIYFFMYTIIHCNNIIHLMFVNTFVTITDHFVMYIISLSSKNTKATMIATKTVVTLPNLFLL